MLVQERKQGWTKESCVVGVGDIRLHKLLFCTYPAAVPMNIYRFAIDMCAETQMWLRVLYHFLFDVKQNWKLTTYFRNFLINNQTH